MSKGAGAARGGGMSLAISCDMIVAADNATFGYPEIEIGLLPAIHYTHLPRIVGRYRAFDLLFTGRAFGAHEALDIGLISRSVPEAKVMEEAAAGKPLARVRGVAAELDRRRLREKGACCAICMAMG